jgi:hypothetical protein
MTTVLDEPALEFDALECVRRVVEAENRRDLVQYRALLSDDDFTLKINDRVIATSADEAALDVARIWDATPETRREVLEISVAVGFVFMRFLLHDATDPDRTSVPNHGDYVGYAVFSVDQNRVKTAWEYLSPLPGRVSTPPAESPIDAGARVRTRRRVLHKLVLPFAALVSWFIQDVLLAAPVVATASKVSVAFAFVLFTALYFPLSVALSFAAIHLLNKRSPFRTPGRITRWLDRTVARHASGRSRRLLGAGGGLGFVILAFWLSAPVLVWAMHAAGIRRRLRLAAVAASAVWTLGFVAIYCGIGAVIPL